MTTIRKQLGQLVGALVLVPAAIALALVGGLSWLPRVDAQTSGSASPITVGTGMTNLNAAATMSAANTAATRTLTGGVTGQRVCLRSLFIQATGAAATFTLTITDGAVVVLDLGTQTATLTGPALQFIGAPLLCATGTNNLVINIGAGGAGAVTTTTTVADRS